MSDKQIEILTAPTEGILSPELEQRMRTFANVLIDRILEDKPLKSMPKDSNLPHKLSI